MKKSYALKRLNTFFCERDDINNEIDHIKMFDHPHIIKYFGEFTMDTMKHMRCIILEFCEVNEIKYWIS